MSNIPSLLASISTVLVLVTFVVIVIWAWSGNRAEDFEEAANLPFDDDQLPSSTEKTHP